MNVETSPHPRSCRACGGTGWMDGKPIVNTVDGRPHMMTTLTDCTHRWWLEDTGWNARRDEPLPPNDPTARQAWASGYRQGHAELLAIRAGTTVVDEPRLPGL
jgi:hypothetical protein